MKVKIRLEVIVPNNTDCTMPVFEIVKIKFDTTQTTIILKDLICIGKLKKKRNESNIRI